MTPSEYKGFKALSNPKKNLRDHMTDLGLIFSIHHRDLQAKRIALKKTSS